MLGLVGKGITFDTGGISIKPADSMEKMKYDMAGGAAMIGAMRAIALLKPKVQRHRPSSARPKTCRSGKAQKPGDVQTAMSGKTIEIINTDAEGRLVLADGLHLRQAARRDPPDRRRHAHRRLRRRARHDQRRRLLQRRRHLSRIRAALATSGEKFWRLPLGDEYDEMIRSISATSRTPADAGAEPSPRPMFLKEFAEDTPWIHLDIAGIAWMEEHKPYIAKGPSGVAGPLASWNGFAATNEAAMSS